MDLHATERTPFAPHQDDLQHKVRLATIYIQSAQEGRSVNHSTDARSLDYLELYYSKWLQSLVLAAYWGLLLLAFFEDKSDGVGLHVVEIGLLSVFIASLTIKFVFSFDTLQDRIHSLLLVALTGDALMCCFVTYFRYIRCLRPLVYLHYSPPITTAVLNLLRTMYRVKGAMLILLFHITFFTIIGVMLFYGTDEGVKHFSSMAEAFVNLIVLLSTCNSPDIYMPAYSSSHVYAVYFVVYVVLGIFLLLNLVLAVVYHDYRVHLKRETRDRLVFIQGCLKLSFLTLAEKEDVHQTDQVVLQKVATKVFQRLGLEPDVAVMYSCLLSKEQNESSGKISENDFKDLVSLLRLEVDTELNEPVTERRVVDVILQHRFRGINTLDFAVNVVLVLSGLYTAVFMSWDLDQYMQSTRLRGRILDSTIIICFVLEISAKIVYAKGYLSNNWNQFDACIVALSATGLVLDYVSWEPKVKSQVFLFVKQFRLLRLLRSLRQLRFYVEVISAVGPVLILFSCVVGILFYVYAIIGYGLLGEVHVDVYNANDFSSFASTLFTLFELMIVNDWHKTMASFVAATGRPVLRLYFIVWYFCMVLLILNSVTSFIVEAVDLQLKRTYRNEKNKLSRHYHRLETTISSRVHDFQRLAMDRFGKRLVFKRRGLTLDGLMNRMFVDEMLEPTQRDVDDFLLMLEHL